MGVATATVRRDGRIVRLDAAELVPGDVFVVEAGDRVPADGRLLSATSLEVQESSLTGEAQAVGQVGHRPRSIPGLRSGTATTAVFMNTAVTRGRGEAVVTATGMATEMGHVAGMLSEADPEPTPLQRQINALSRTLAAIAGAVIAVVALAGVVRGQDFGVLFVSAVSLAVAAIPEGLPAVVAFTLAMGASPARQAGGDRETAGVGGDPGQHVADLHR